MENSKLGLESLRYVFFDFLNFMTSKCISALKCAFFQKIHQFWPKMWNYFFKKGAFKDGVWYKSYKGKKPMFTSYYSRAKSAIWIFWFLSSKCAFFDKILWYFRMKSHEFMWSIGLFLCLWEYKKAHLELRNQNIHMALLAR